MSFTDKKAVFEKSIKSNRNLWEYIKFVTMLKDFRLVRLSIKKEENPVKSWRTASILKSRTLNK